MAVARELTNRCKTPSLFLSAQAADARANRDAALGYVQKPHGPETVLPAVRVVERIIGGETLNEGELRYELELFQRLNKA